MKSIIIGIIVLGLVGIAMTMQPKDNQYKGFSELVSRVFPGNSSKRAHDLDLSKYRPNFRSE